MSMSLWKRGKLPPCSKANSWRHIKVSQTSTTCSTESHLARWLKWQCFSHLLPEGIWMLSGTALACLRCFAVPVKVDRLTVLPPEECSLLRWGAVWSSSWMLSTMKREAIHQFETSVLRRATRPHITEDNILHGDHNEIIKSYTVFLFTIFHVFSLETEN